MDKLDAIVYNQIDFLLPTQRFRIEYSTTSQKRLSFIREFLLRIVNIEPVKPAVIGQYFNLSPCETDEALSDLIEKGYIQFSEDDRVTLTNSGKELFYGELDAKPELSTIEDSSGAFSFDLISYNYCGSEQKRESWQRGIKLEASAQSRANSQQNAFEFFQNRFDTILDRGDIRKYNPDDYDARRPQLYKMGEVTKLRENPLRIPIEFKLLGEQHERTTLEALEDSDEIAVAITEAIDNLRFVETDFAAAWKLFDDLLSPNICIEDTLHTRDLISIQERAVQDQNETIPFIGNITCLPVWEIVNSVLQSTVQQMADTHQDGIPNLTWLIPANPGRCKSDSIIQCLSDLKANSRTTGKKTKTLFNLDVLLPIAGIDDKQGRAAWLYDMKPHKEHCSLYNEGFESYNSIFDGNLEVIVLPNEFAVVAYHFYREGLTPVPIPFGFITSNRQKVAHVSDFVERLCSEQIALNQPRIIGLLADEKKQ